MKKQRVRETRQIKDGIFKKKKGSDVTKYSDDIKKAISDKYGKKKMTKEDLKKIVREELAFVMKEYDRDVGHFAKKGGKIYADTTFINRTKGVIPGASLEHMGFGEFYLQTNDGQVDFMRRSTQIEGFVGRTHELGDDRDGKLVDVLIKAMVKAKKAEEVK